MYMLIIFIMIGVLQAELDSFVYYTLPKKLNLVRRVAHFTDKSGCMVLKILKPP